jgi:hypothetical protein
MKTVVLTGLSCLFLAGVVCILNKKSQLSGILSFSQSINAASPLNQPENGNNTATTEQLFSDSHTLNDSHWLDDDAFQKAVEADVLSQNQEPNVNVPGETTAPETFIPASPKERKVVPAAPAPSVKQLILELAPDTTTNKKVPVEVV